jgi:HEAT repeat protein
MITTLLRKMRCDEAFEVIAEFLDDPHFFVRWHVMRELLGLDAVAALPHLCRLASGDPHPEVRRAAGAVLARIRLQNPALGKAA